MQNTATTEVLAHMTHQTNKNSILKLVVCYILKKTKFNRDSCSTSLIDSEDTSPDYFDDYQGGVGFGYCQATAVQDGLIAAKNKELALRIFQREHLPNSNSSSLIDSDDTGPVDVDDDQSGVGFGDSQATAVQDGLVSMKNEEEAMRMFQREDLPNSNSSSLIGSLDTGPVDVDDDQGGADFGDGQATAIQDGMIAVKNEYDDCTEDMFPLHSASDALTDWSIQAISDGNSNQAGADSFNPECVTIRLRHGP